MARPSVLPERSASRPVAWWPAAALLACFIVIGTLGANRDSGNLTAWTVAAVFVAAAAAVATRWLPRSGVLVAGAAAGAFFLGGLQPGPIFLALPLAAGLAALGCRPRALLAWVGAALALLATGLVVGQRLADEADLLFWPIAGSVALTSGAAAVGWWYAGRREMREQQSLRAATEEQLRMAQDLHDGVGHGLAVIAMQAGVALHVLDQDPAAARRSLEAIRDTSRESLDALRTELARMSGGPADRRPAAGLADLDGLLERVRAGGLAIERRGEPGPVPEATGQVVYAVVQESLTNVLRHAGAERAVVSFDRRAGELVVTVSDDGRGPIGQDAGMGLEGMRSRVEALGGSVRAGPGPTGFQVRAEIPVPEQ